MGKFAGFFRIESRHLMNKKSVGSSFDGQIGGGGASVVKSSAIRLARLDEIQMCDGNPEDWCVLGPDLVGFDQRAEKLSVSFVVVFRGDDKRPGLFIAAGGRPTSGPAKAPPNTGRNRLAGKCPRTPTILHKVGNRMIGLCGLLHFVSSRSLGRGVSLSRNGRQCSHPFRE